MDAIERGVKDVLFRCTNQLARAWDTYKAAIDKLLNNQCRTLTPIEVTLLLLTVLWVLRRTPIQFVFTLWLIVLSAATASSNTQVAEEQQP